MVVKKNDYESLPPHLGRILSAITVPRGVAHTWGDVILPYQRGPFSRSDANSQEPCVSPVTPNLFSPLEPLLEDITAAGFVALVLLWPGRRSFILFSWAGRQENALRFSW